MNRKVRSPVRLVANFWATPCGPHRRARQNARAEEGAGDIQAQASHPPIRRLQHRRGDRETPSLWTVGESVFRTGAHTMSLAQLDEWRRHRLRAIHLKHWRCGTTIYRELVRLGAKPPIAQLVARNNRRWWCTAALSNVLTIACFDCLGMPRLTWPQLFELPGVDPHGGWCGRGRSATLIAPIPIRRQPMASITYCVVH